jgi:hypothetical protein
MDILSDDIRLCFPWLVNRFCQPSADLPFTCLLPPRRSQP